MPNPQIAPALVERMVVLMRDLASRISNVRQDYEMMNAEPIPKQLREAVDIVAELPEPVDADDKLAVECAAKAYQCSADIVSCDSSAFVAARDAIRRVRAEQQPAKATTWQEEH